MDVAAGVYHTVSHIGIFDPALKTVALPTFSGSTPPPPFPCVNKYAVYMYTVCEGGGGMGLWASGR
jgi:hypothetical protein